MEYYIWDLSKSCTEPYKESVASLEMIASWQMAILRLRSEVGNLPKRQTPKLQQVEHNQWLEKEMARP
ncbi:hypothetical protein [Denitrobaculum tricleocarpae]|uniref:Uncharacterized protein n=1 Tax=Denitrobaculum tricleocarpae TaxID=2591009 RepID=A0A545U1M4_9PROT|nr:hypothetical protein [Denitrobaculum tricleocarpae]TQV83303.1 hypothetical protein FKG95_01500 [Denitrobaculum tricleocarpae]